MSKLLNRAYYEELIAELTTRINEVEETLQPLKDLKALYDFRRLQCIMEAKGIEPNYAIDILPGAFDPTAEDGWTGMYVGVQKDGLGILYQALNEKGWPRGPVCCLVAPVEVLDENVFLADKQTHYCLQGRNNKDTGAAE